jgi:hypothetical protein
MYRRVDAVLEPYKKKKRDEYVTPEDTRPERDEYVTEKGQYKGETAPKSEDEEKDDGKKWKIAAAILQGLGAAGNKDKEHASKMSAWRRRFSS